VRSRVTRASSIQFSSGSHSSADLQSVHAREHSAFAAALISAFVAKNPSSIALRRQDGRQLSWGSAMAGAATTMVGYQNASLYKIDHPCRSIHYLGQRLEIIYAL